MDVTGIEVLYKGGSCYEVKWHGQFLCYLTAHDKEEAIERGKLEAMCQMRGC